MFCSRKIIFLIIRHLILNAATNFVDFKNSSESNRMQNINRTQDYKKTCDHRNILYYYTTS